MNNNDTTEGEMNSTGNILISDGGVDVSNMGRCVVCGGTIDMEHEDDLLVVMEDPDPDVEGITAEDGREAIARALRRDDSPESHTLAQAYEEGQEIVMHSRCHDETALPNLYGNYDDEADFGE